MRILLAIAISLAYTLARASDFTFTAFGSGSEKYWIVEPADSTVNEKLVVFLHGHAASNPECYGNWILHLVHQGFIVLFPKYQAGALPFSVIDSEDEERRIGANIDSATAYLDGKYGTANRELHFIGHSLGGLLAANLADCYGESGEYRVASLCLVQPGQKHLRLGALDTYEHIDPHVRIVCVSGSNDRMAGKTFSSYLLKHTPTLSNDKKIHFLLRRMEHDGKVIGSTHEEPVCPNSALNGKNVNAVIAGTRAIGKTDLADTHCFWKIADFLVRGDALPLETLADLGSWDDGTPIGKMLVLSDTHVILR